MALQTKGVAFFENMSSFWVEKNALLSKAVKQARERLLQPTGVVLYGETGRCVEARLWAV